MSVNRVILIGHLGRNPETRYTQSGDAVCAFSIATSEKWKSRDGKQTEKTEWHNIVMYRKLAEIAQQYLVKGSQIYIEGKIQSEKYIGKDGIERVSYKIIADKLNMLGSKNNDQGIPPAPSKQTETSAQFYDDLDSDIPF